MGGGKASPVQGEVSTRSVDGGVVRQCNNPSVSLAADSPLYTRGPNANAHGFARPEYSKGFFDKLSIPYTAAGGKYFPP